MLPLPGMPSPVGRSKGQMDALASDVHISAPPAQMHSMLAFEFAGGWSDFKGSIAVTVLQFLLGGGGSFSSGGPGASLTPSVHPPSMYIMSACVRGCELSRVGLCLSGGLQCCLRIWGKSMQA